MCQKTKMAVYLKVGLRMVKALIHQRMEQFVTVCTEYPPSRFDSFVKVVGYHYR